MSMPLLYTIEKINNTVTIQSSVSMYTEEFAQYTFIQYNRGCDKACLEPPWRALRSQCMCSLRRLA